MAAIVACKLPHGLIIEHNRTRITLLGANIGEDLANVSRNGAQFDNPRRSHGFGLTTLSDAETSVFNQWAAEALYIGGEPSKGKLAEPFTPLGNGSILGPFKTEAEARKECAAMAGVVVTGFEGLDPTKEGVEKNADAGKN